MPRLPKSPVSRSKSVLGGIPVFAGTRVPVQTFMDYIEAGDGIDDFLDDFPTVKRSQALALLKWAGAAIVADARPPR
jgi:uncharacterized protein (DUF433 family)